MIVTLSFLCEDLTTLTPYHGTLTSSVMIFFVHHLCYKQGRKQHSELLFFLSACWRDGAEMGLPGCDGEKSLVHTRENYCLLRPRQQATHSTNSSTVALPLTSMVGSCKAAACLATSSVWSASRASKFVRAVSGSLVRPAMLHNDPRWKKAVRLHSPTRCATSLWKS